MITFHPLYSECCPTTTLSFVIGEALNLSECVHWRNYKWIICISYYYVRFGSVQIFIVPQEEILLAARRQKNMKHDHNKTTIRRLETWKVLLLSTQSRIKWTVNDKSKLCFINLFIFCIKETPVEQVWKPAVCVCSLKNSKVEENEAFTGPWITEY